MAAQPEQDRKVGPQGSNYAAAIAASLIAETVFVVVGMGLMRARGKDPWKITRASASLGPVPKCQSRRASYPETWLRFLPCTSPTT